VLAALSGLEGVFQDMPSREGSMADAEAFALAAAMVKTRAAMAELVEAVRPRVAMTFDEARAADDRGERPIFCQCDVLNPCWAPGMPITAPLRHWGYTPDMAGDGLACPDCRLRAALANVGSAS
jgi:hypothetical protein